jgi:hypothetical protein
MRHYRLGQKKWVFIDWMNIFAGYGTDPQGRPLKHGFLVPRGIELRTHRPHIESEPEGDGVRDYIPI